MYVHIGGEVVLLIPDIIAILDARLIADSLDNERFIERAKAQGRMRVEMGPHDRKAVVVTAGGVYESPISPVTLVRRITHAAAELGRGEV